MTRTISSTNQAQLAATDAEPVHLVRIGTLRLASTPQDLVVHSRTHIGGDLDALGALEEGLEVRSHSLEVSLSPVSTDTRRLWSTDRQGEEVVIHLGFLDDDGSLLDTPLIVWEGFVQGVHEDVSRGLQVVRCESRLSRLDRSAEFHFGPESQEARHSGDKFFEFVASMQDLRLEWASGQEVVLSTGRVPPSSLLPKASAYFRDRRHLRR